MSTIPELLQMRQTPAGRGVVYGGFQPIAGVSRAICTLTLKRRLLPTVLGNGVLLKPVADFVHTQMWALGH